METNVAAAGDQLPWTAPPARRVALLRCAGVRLGRLPAAGRGDRGWDRLRSGHRRGTGSSSRTAAWTRSPPR